MFVEIFGKKNIELANLDEWNKKYQDLCIFILPLLIKYYKEKKSEINEI